MLGLAYCTPDLDIMPKGYTFDGFGDEDGKWRTKQPMVISERC
ncbi:hypothetical protein [Vibrio chagasii]|nr:hypothetical protein [Vibrio chagasii]